MGRWKNLVLLIGISSILVVEGLLLVAAVLIRSIWRCVITLGIMAFTLYFFYVRLYQKKEAQYPMVPPEAKADIYFPRTNIPRPIYEDIRKMQEKKRRLDKTKKKARRKKK